MSSVSFVKELIKLGREAGDKPVSKTIGKVKFEYGFSGFCSGHSMISLFRPASEPGKIDEVKAAMTEHTKKLGGRGSAIFGLRYTAPAEFILSFDADFGKERFIMAETEEADFIQITDAMEKLGILPNDWVWCAYESIESPSAVEKGEKGKFETREGKMVFPKIIIPVEKFANEQEARAATGSNSRSVARDDSQWSDVARTTYSNLAILVGYAPEVTEWYTKMIGGTPFNNDEEHYKLPKPITPPAVKQQLAELYAVESSDIDILLSMDIAF